MIPRILGPTLARIRKWPREVISGDSFPIIIEEAERTVKFQLRKVLNLGYAVGNVNMEAKELKENISNAINFLVGLCKKGWNNIKVLRIKTTMGTPILIYGNP